jgi:hypothetical protein
MDRRLPPFTIERLDLPVVGHRVPAFRRQVALPVLRESVSSAFSSGTPACSIVASDLQSTASVFSGMWNIIPQVYQNPRSNGLSMSASEWCIRVFDFPGVPAAVAFETDQVAGAGDGKLIAAHEHRFGVDRHNRGPTAFGTVAVRIDHTRPREKLDLPTPATLAPSPKRQNHWFIGSRGIVRPFGVTGVIKRESLRPIQFQTAHP